MSLKLSQITDGGAFAPSTDKIVTVRSGATDVLTSTGTVITKNVSDVTKSVVASVSGTITVNHIAQFVDAAGTVQDGGVLGSAAHATASSASGTVAAVSGGVTAGHMAVFSDTAGTVVDGGVPAGTYTLPTATTSVLGGVKIDGTTITISSGVISAVASSPSFIGGTGTASRTGANSFVAGGGATDAGVAEAIVIGHNASVSGAFGADSVSIGHTANASGNAGDPTVSIGSGSATNGSGAVAVGYGAQATASKAIAIGDSITEANPNTVTIGNSVNTLGIDGSGRFKITGVTTTTGAQAGTITNATSAGNPAIFIPVKVNGSTYYIPAWS